MAATLDSYDAVNFLPSPMPFGSHSLHLDYMSNDSNLDPLDQYSNFDSEAYVSGDEMSYSHGSLAHQAMLKRMSSAGYEETMLPETQFDQLPPDAMADSSSMDRESKYLSFAMPSFPYRLYNESFQQSYINVQSRLHGMFFLAESQWPASMDTAPPPPELTCYRRNLFQITGSVTIPRNLRYVFTEDGRRLPIFELELHVSATESVEGNPVKIISVPWKTPNGAETSKQDDKAEKEPPTIALDKLAGTDLDSDYNSIPIQWKRLQFRIATANNGRRKELQQHFTLHLKVTATVSTGEKMCIVESQSGAVIVRGRSPRNFAARKDVPLSSSSTSRKHVPTLSRSHESSGATHQITSAPQQGSPSVLEDVTIPHSVFDNPIMSKPDIDLNGWQHSVSSFPLPEQSPVSQPYSMIPPVAMGFTGVPSPDMPHTPFGFAFSPDMVQNPSAPVSLHFQSDDEGGGSPFAQHQHQSSRTSSRPPTSDPNPNMMAKARSATYANPTQSPNFSTEPPSKQRPAIHSHNSSMAMNYGSTHALQSTAALTTGYDYGRSNLVSTSSHTSNPGNRDVPNNLYEYFPLTLDEWQPPVDAVFRPHVVHHEIPIDPRSPGGKSSKRYFSEVV